MYFISAVVITYNEENNIQRCLDSLQAVADEIIVLDSFSTDKTVEIAKSSGAIVKQDTFSGYIQQKNKAVALASHDYILSLDADEVLDNNLIDAIVAAKKTPAADAYYMNRCTNYCGRYIRNGTWYPDKKVRLFNKNAARWGGVNPHDRIEFPRGHKNIQQLKGDILHFSFSTIEEHLKKNDKYSSLSAEALYSKGARSTWFKILVNPFWAFFHGFVLRRGFLDGFYGLVISINSAHATFLKYAKLHQLQHNKKVQNKHHPVIKPGIIKEKKEEMV